MAKKNDTIDTNTNDSGTQMTEKTRQRRINFTVVTPTTENSVGTVKVTVHNGIETAFSKDLAGLSPFIATFFLMGIRDRLANAVSGLTDAVEIGDTVLQEIDNLTNEVISVTIGKVKTKQIPDILRAWASLYKEDIEDEAVLAKYTSAWDSRDEEGKKAIRTNERISAVLYKIQAERKEAKVNQDIELPAL